MAIATPSFVRFRTRLDHDPAPLHFDSRACNGLKQVLARWAPDQCKFSAPGRAAADHPRPHLRMMKFLHRRFFGARRLGASIPADLQREI
jgi:hypothetical protein